VSSIWLSVCAGAVAVATAMISGMVRLKAQRQSNVAEQLRWQAVERLAASHGPEVLADLPRLARELRDLPESAAPMRRRDADESVAAAGGAGVRGALPLQPGVAERPQARSGGAGHAGQPRAGGQQRAAHRGRR
jgi:hypothetical protein